MSWQLSKHHRLAGRVRFKWMARTEPRRDRGWKGSNLGSSSDLHPSGSEEGRWEPNAQGRFIKFSPEFF